MHIKIISINKHFCRFVQNVNCLKRFTIMNAGDLLLKKKWFMDFLIYLLIKFYIY